MKLEITTGRTSVKQGKVPKAIHEMAKGMRTRNRESRRPPKEIADPLQGSVNSFAASHGEYERHNGRTVNRGGTPVARWKKEGLLSETQEAAIQHCIRLWEITTSSTRLVANLDRTIFGSPGDGHSAEIEARQDLHRIRDGFPAPYWSVFEGVCRFDMPAGVAGSDLANDDVTRRTMARTIVCMVADMIYLRERLSY